MLVLLIIVLVKKFLFLSLGYLEIIAAANRCHCHNPKNDISCRRVFPCFLRLRFGFFGIFLSVLCRFFRRFFFRFLFPVIVGKCALRHRDCGFQCGGILR